MILSRAKIYFSLCFLCCVMFGQTIDCFKCISMNKDYSACDDPFHNNYTTDIYEAPCMGGRKGRNGVFPATFCIKIIGVFEDNGETITVRGCSLDSGTLTTDTELVRMSHCGGFFYEERFVKGCVQSCNNENACNKSNRGNASNKILFGYLMFFFVYFLN